jgi:tripartite-type tricarboxylate transporter receptor subunit TctC
MLKAIMLSAAAIPVCVAQDAGQRSIRLVIGFPPGGTTDVMGRIVANKMFERHAQRVVVDNRPGVFIGAEIVAHASPDGLTLFMGTSGFSTVTSLYSKVPFDPVKDFAPIAPLATTPHVITVHPNLPVKSVSELIAYAKSRLEPMLYAASAPGSGQHLAAELFKRMNGIELTYVPYKGTSGALPDLLSGRLQMGIDNVVVMSPHVKRGALRGLGVTGTKRSSVIPDLPTIAEAGTSGFQAIGWFGLFAPARTPPQTVKKLNAQIRAVMEESESRERLLALGAEPVSGSPDDLRKLLAYEIAKWRKVIRDAGIHFN